MAHLTGHCLALSSLVTAVVWCLCLLWMPGQDHSSFTKREQVQNSSFVQSSSTSSAAFLTKVKAVSSNSSVTSTSNSSTVSSSFSTVVVISVTQTETLLTTSSSIKTVTSAFNALTLLTAAETTSSSSLQASTSTSSTSFDTSSISTTLVDQFPITSSQAVTSSSTSTPTSATSSSTLLSSSNSNGSINTSDTQVSNLSPTSTVPMVAAASSGFWSNKSAVAGTFTVVALIIVALLAVLFTFLMKRKNGYKADYRRYERYPEPESGTPVPPSENLSELHQTPMDPFADPASYLNTQAQDYNSSQQLPAASHANPHPSIMATNDDDLYDPFATPNPRIVPASTLTSVTTLIPGHPYANARGKLAPVDFKESVERDPHRPSIDSFYGAVGSSEQAGTAH